jgi:hypothetical protein
MKSFLALSIIIAAHVNGDLASAQVQISRSVLGSGGERAANDQFAVAGTAGQMAIGAATNNTVRVDAGFWSQVSLEPVAVESLPDNLPRAFRLDQNYPNPFNPATTIRFALPRTEQVTLKIFDVRGREVATLVNEKMPAGEHSVNFNGQRLASGIYFYRLRAGEFVQQRKLALVK